MKKSKKLLCLLFVTLMFLTFSVTAFASNTTNSDAIIIEVATDKAEYKTTGVAEITATITNVSGTDINNVTAQVVFNDLAPAGKRTSQTNKSVDVLKSGESFSFTYKATLDKDEHDLNIFQKIILWFVRLFNGGYTSNNNSIDVVAENVTEIEFGKFTAENVVQVGYGEKRNTNNYTYEELIQDVDIDKSYERTEENTSIDEETNIQYTNNIIMIMFEDDCTKERKAEIINSIGGKVVGGNETYDELHIEIKKSTFKEIEAICDRLNENEDIYAMIDYAIASPDVSIIPNDLWSFMDNEEESYTNWENPFSTANNWGAVAVDALGAWNYNDYFKPINIGVIDNGFSNTNPDLNLRIISDVNTAEDHGTHVAGIIGATANNKKGITGIVWNKNILAYDAKESTDSNAKMYNKDIYNGIEELVKQGCKVINLSIGMSTNLIDSNHMQSEKFIKTEGKTASEKMAKLLKKGYDFIIVQSAGNGAGDGIGVDAINNGSFCSVTKDNCYTSSKISADEIMDRIIIVANAMRDFESQSYVCSEDSNGGIQVDIAAPGFSILSTVTSTEYPYQTMSGTSQAAPYVAGVASLVWSVNSDLTGDEVKQIVLESATSGDIVVKNNLTSPTTGDYYMVNAKLAVEKAIYNVIGKVIDNESNKPIENATVNCDEPGVSCVTDKDGRFALYIDDLSKQHTFNFSHEYYNSVEITVASNSYSLLEEIKLTRKSASITGTVTDSETGNPISNVNVEVIDNESDSLDPIVTATTDSSGKYTLKLPYSDYSLSYKHSDYEDYGTSLTVNYESYTKDVTLSPKGSDSGDDKLFTDFAGGDGTKENPYQVAIPAQLNAVRNDLSAHYIQTADIDMSEWGNWEPIGQVVVPHSVLYNPLDLDSFYFTGSFDGNGFDIKNLSIGNGIRAPYYDCYGLFAGLNKATIKNVTLQNLVIDIDKSDIDYKTIYQNENVGLYICVGGISGLCKEKCVIDNCRVNGKISVRNCNDAYIGGITGKANEITNCINHTQISISALAEGRAEMDSTVYCGGISGQSSKISTCANYGDIQVIAGTFVHLGGICNRGLLSNCVNLGNLSGSVCKPFGHSSFAKNCNVGGISGATSSKYVKSCVNYGNISSYVDCSELSNYGNGYSKACAGGIVGYCGYYGSGKIENCYNLSQSISCIKISNSGEVIKENEGRICGYSINTINCYSLSTTLVNGTTVNSSVHTIETNARNVAGADLTSDDFLKEETYDGFDFEDIWEINSTIGGAILKHQHYMSDFAIIKEANCTEQGKEKSECLYCDYSETREINAIGHSFRTVITAETCTKDGYSTHYCKNCSYSYQSDITYATGHSYNDSGVCEICGYDNTQNCKCKCHRNTITGRIYEILYRIIRIKECSCGANHY